MKLSKELQASLDKAEKTLVKVMQEDGTETGNGMNQKKIRQIDQTIIDYYSKKAVSDSS